MQVTLKASDLQIPATIRAFDHTQSKHTGKALRVLRIQFDRPRSDEQSGVDAVKEAKHITIEDPKGTIIGQFKIGDTSSSYRDDGPSIQHSWALTELENLNPSSLILDSLKLIPYQYAEEFVGDDVLKIEASVKLTRDEERQLRALPLYFSVVRKGINDVPCEMRFGKLLWSEAGDAGIKMSIILMDRRYDKGEPLPGLMEPQFSNLALRVFESRQILRNLLSLLEQKGMVSDLDRQKVNAVTDEQITAQGHELDRVKDIDTYF